MDVKNVLDKLKKFDGGKIVICGDSGSGWSNINDIVIDGSSVKIIMSDNVIFSDDRTANTKEQKITAHNKERDEIFLCDSKDFCDRRSISGLCTSKISCDKQRKTSPIS